MAGTIIADYIRTDANKLSLNVGNTTIASINSSGILNSSGGVILNANGTFASGVTLPASSVTGQVVASQITDGIIDYTKLAAGTVIQTQVLNSRTRVTLAPGNTLTEASSNYRVSITPKLSNSMMIINYHIPASASSSWSANWILRSHAKRFVSGTAYDVSSIGATNGSRIPIAGFLFRSSNGYDYNDGIPITMRAIDFPGTTSAIQYGFHMSTEGGTIYFGYTYTDSSSWPMDSNIIITVQEIKQ